MARVRSQAWGLLTIAAGVVVLVGCAPPEDVPPNDRRASAFGAVIQIDFDTDAAGAPLARGTVLAEQYAAWGIHFSGGYAIGAESVDFPDYQNPHGNMVCTASAAVESYPVSPWTVQRCFPGQPAANVPLSMTLDFPACLVSMAVYAKPDSLGGSIGSFAVGGRTSTGASVQASQREVASPLPPTMPETAFTGWVPDSSAGPIPAFGADIRTVGVSVSPAVGAIDDLLIIPCDASAGGAAGAGGAGGSSGQGGAPGVSSIGGGSGTAGTTVPVGSGGSTAAGGKGGRGGQHEMSGSGGVAGSIGAGGGRPASGGGPAGGSSGSSSGGVPGQAGAPGAAGGRGGAASGGTSPPDAGAGLTGGPGHPGAGCSYASTSPSAGNSQPWAALALAALALRRRRRTSSAR